MLRLISLLTILVLASGCTYFEKVQRKPQVPTTYQSTIPDQTHLGRLVSSFATPITNNDTIRIHNLFTSVRRLSGQEIKPGETLSFRAVMGGFRPGTNFQWGRWMTQSKPVGIPEGPEQVATTLYMAATKAGLRVRQGELVRQNQPWAPKIGQVLLTGARDLRINNPQNQSVRVYGLVTGRSIIIGIYK